MAGASGNVQGALPSGLDPRLHARAKTAAAWLQQQATAQRTVTVVHHIDADGVTAGAIAATALDRANIPKRMIPVKSLDDHHIQLIRDAHPDALWFCDLGSTAYMHFPELPRLVCDHHQLVRDGTEESFAHLNPLLDDVSGETVSGAGCAYLAAAALEDRNIDLLPLALVGASADLQDRRGGFHGTNALLVELGQASGLVATRTDLSWFGTEGRALSKFLSLGREPAVPGITGDRNGIAAFLAQHQGADADAPWAAHPEALRVAMRSALANRLLDCGMAADVPRLWRTVVTLAKETPGTPTRELQEFGTLLNSTARYGKPDIGIAVARGDRDARGAYGDALDLLDGHRKHLVSALESLAAAGVKQANALQWVHLEDKVLDTVVGIVAGMALGSLGLPRDRPLIAFAHTPDGRTKVSSRAPHELAGRIDLATALRESAASVGGQGGGHPGAAGATIPRGSEAAFLVALDDQLAVQLGRVLVTPAPA